MGIEEIDLALALPIDAVACEACIARLVDALRVRPGITLVHVDRDRPKGPALCLHYDSSIVQLDDVRALVESSGASLGGRYEHVSAPAVGLRHERHARLVEDVLRRLPGVLHASAAFGSRRVLVEFDPAITCAEELRTAARDAGVGWYEEPASPAIAADALEAHEHESGGPFGRHSELAFSIGCGVLTGVGWGLERMGVSGLVSTSLFGAAYVLGAWFTVQEAFIALRARRFEIDFLMLLAAAGAAVLGEWFEGALLLFLFSLGHALEGFAMGRARRAITALAKMVPDVALRIVDGGEREVPVGDLAVGDRVLVKPNTRFPADGFVVAGAGSVNQAPITGESAPVDKWPVLEPDVARARPGDLDPKHRVFAGSINGGAALTVEVSKPSADSTLARVVRMVAEAETQKSPTQQFTDRFERVFVPVILLVVASLLFAPLVIDEPFARSFYRAMAVLVAASPCALAIATPSAVLSGVARAARSGVLFKGGAHLESLGLVEVMAFDKTGTLTEGKPKLVDVIPVEGASETDLLSVALAVEKQSDHPLALAVVDGAVQRMGSVSVVPDAREVQAIVGFGVRARVRGKEVVIGKPGLFGNERDLPEEVRGALAALERQGRTVMVVRMDAQFLGVLGVMDAPREEVREVVESLRDLGVRRTVMLSGDNQRVADAVARQVGIQEAFGDLLPEGKVTAIAGLAGSSIRVAMVGDGVNDAPAMANATVGIAMGASGSDVALETADVALMADDLRGLPFAVGLSRAARRVIRQNLWGSLGMVAFLVPATILGLAKIGVAVALHEGSTLLVVLNALRLLAYPQDRGPERPVTGPGKEIVAAAGATTRP